MSGSPPSIGSAPATGGPAAATAPTPGRAVRATRRAPWFGIRTKALFVLGLAIAASLDAVWVVQRNFARVAEDMRLITEVELPALTRVAALASAAHRLSSTRAALLSRPSLHRNQEIEAESARIMDEAEAILADLRGQALTVLDTAALAALERRLRAITGSLDAFGQRASRLAQLNERADDHALRLRRLALAITDLAAAPAEPCVARWQGGARAVIVELLAARSVRHPARLAERQQGVDAALQGMRAAHPCTDATARIEAQLAAFGGPAGLIPMRAEQYRLEQQTDEALRRALYQVRALLHDVDDLMRTSQQAARGHSERLAALVAESVALIALVPVILVAITVLTFLYLNRALLRPVRRLHLALAERRAGRDRVDLPRTGGPEVYGILDDVRATLDTLAVRERELAQAKVAAERASQAKSRFLAHMSHELRAPLNVVLGQTRLLERAAPGDPETRARCAAIRRSGAHLLAMIDDLLDIAAIEAGRLRLQPGPMDLDTLLADLVLSSRGAAAAKGLAFDAALAPGLPTLIEADGRRLRQVLQNLLDNAVKYTEHGEVRFSVGPVGGAALAPDGAGVGADAGVGAGAGASLRLRFVVADTGPGIPAGEQARLFVAFERLDAGQAGSGLGLAICHELTTLMGGRLSLDSAPGRGSRFQLELPVRVLAGREAAPAPLSAQLPAPLPARMPARMGAGWSGCCPVPAAQPVTQPVTQPVVRPAAVAATPGGPPLPPALELDTALELARSGDTLRLREWCDDLAAADPGLAPFVALVRARVAAGGAGLTDWLGAWRREC